MYRTSEAPESINGVCHWILFSGSSWIVPVDSEERGTFRLDSSESLPFDTKAEEYLGELDGEHYFAADSDMDFTEDSNVVVKNLRSDYKTISDELFSLVGYASGVIHWSRSFKFCGHCGTKTVRLETERAMKCPECKSLSFPRLSPAIIVAVTHGDKMLLAHNTNFQDNQYSTLAGFVEVGESIETTVAREVMEEVGVRLKNIQYVRSQSWPFPDSLMLGFTAEYDGGEITPDGVEITDARWFTKEDLADVVIPTKKAIARKLIESVFGEIDRP